MKYDDIVTYLGEFGPYQRRLYLLLCLPMSSMALQIMLTVFTLGVPDHRCSVPGWENDTYALQGDTHAQAVNESIPVGDEETQPYSKCLVYDFSNVTRSSLFPWTNRTQQCSHWVYDDNVFGSNVVSELSWVCDRMLWKSHSQMLYMLGSMVGCVVLGPPADLIGRKKMYLLGAALHSAASISVAFAASFPVFAFLYFLNGLSNPAIWNNGFVIVVELVGASKRVYAGIFVEFFWAFGCILAVTGAYLVRDWQHLQLIVSVPTVLFLTYYWIIPESPRWLISKGRYQDANQIIRQTAKVNKKTLPSDLFGEDALSTEKQEPVWKIFTNCTLVYRSLIIFLNWTVCSLGFYGLSLNVASLGGNVYTNAYIGLTAEVIGYIICLLLLDRVGRRGLHCSTIILGGLCCTATIIPVLVNNQNLTWLSTALALTGRGFVSISFAVVWLYTSELFPTVIRNSSMSIANTCARIGGAVSPYIANLALLIPGDTGRAVPLIIFGVSMLTAGLLALLLPETLNRTLPETIRDATKMKRSLIKEDEKSPDFGCMDEEESVQLNCINDNKNVL